jgi:hypothetical protein
MVMVGLKWREESENGPNLLWRIGIDM